MARTVKHRSRVSTAADADSYTAKLVKYVPAETVSLVTTGFAIFSPVGRWVWFWVALAALVNAIYLYGHVLLGGTTPPPRPFFYALSVLAFVGWAIAVIPAVQKAAGLEGTGLRERSAYVLMVTTFAIPLLDVLLDHLAMHWPSRTQHIDGAALLISGLIVAGAAYAFHTQSAHASDRTSFACHRRVAGVVSARPNLRKFPGGPASQMTTFEKTQLLQTFEPLTCFDQTEEWAPVSVSAFLRGQYKASLFRRSSATAAQWEPTPGPVARGIRSCRPARCELDVPGSLENGDADYLPTAARLTNWEASTVYGVVNDATTPPNSLPVHGIRYVLRYWYFYYFDDWRSPGGRFLQVHEGDWESVIVGLSARFHPLYAGYSEHNYGVWRPWGDVDVVGGSHPVDYVAAGSHANYFTPGDHGLSLARDVLRYTAATPEQIDKLATKSIRLIDQTGGAHVLGPPGFAENATVVRLVPRHQGWTRFKGYWGEGERYFFDGIEVRLLRGQAPATPAFADGSLPLSWHRDRSS